MRIGAWKFEVDKACLDGPRARRPGWQAGRLPHYVGVRAGEGEPGLSGLEHDLIIRAACQELGRAVGLALTGLEVKREEGDGLGGRAGGGEEESSKAQDPSSREIPKPKSQAPTP